MTLDKRTELQSELGQLLICGFDGLEPTPEILDLIRHRGLGAIILFSRNIDSPEQVARLTRTLQQAARDANHKRPLLIAVDQENGIVRRLGQSGVYLPGNMALGAMGSPTDARKVASVVGDELHALGINWNLAPVLDVNSNPLNPVIGVRSFGQDPALVASLGLAQILGYQQSGVVANVKHFPGHGDTDTDSHLDVPVINKSLRQLEGVELVPFRHVFGAKGKGQPASVMVAHVSLPQIISNGRVSSLAPEVVKGLLREKMHYDGLVVTDCLEMDAVKETVGSAAGAVLALQAGNDMAMISHTPAFQADAFDKMNNAFLHEEFDLCQVEQSLQRVAKLKDTFLSWEDALREHDLRLIGSSEHTELSKQLYDCVPTLVRDYKRLLPLKLNNDEKILFLAAHVPVTRAIDSEAAPFDALNRSLCARHPTTEYIIFDKTTASLDDSIKAASVVIIGTANANLHHFQSEMVKTALRLAKKVIIVAVINPYDLMAFPTADTYLVTYEYTPPALEAAARVLFGEITPNTQMPVTIPGITSPASNPGFTVEKYCHENDFCEVTELWRENFGKEWPLSNDKIELVLTRAVEAREYVVRSDTGRVIGFVATQLMQGVSEMVGWLTILMVAPEFHRHGIGSMLHNAAMDNLHRRGATALRLGSKYPRFFPGLPEGQSGALAFFKRQGWHMENELVHDLVGNLEDYTTPDELTCRMRREQIWFGRVEPGQLWELYAFQKRYFPSWLATYQHHAELGDFQDLIVARQGGEGGPIVGSLVLNSTHVTHKKRSDLIWIDEGLFGSQSGGMACVGIATEQRGRGIGLGIVAYANETLKQRGVKKAYVDWVEAVGFYDRLGYKIWRSYRGGRL